MAPLLHFLRHSQAWVRLVRRDGLDLTACCAVGADALGCSHIQRIIIIIIDLVRHQPPTRAVLLQELVASNHPRAAATTSIGVPIRILACRPAPAVDACAVVVVVVLPLPLPLRLLLALAMVAAG